MLISHNKFVSISVVLHFYHILYSFSRLVFIQIHIGNAKIAHKFVPNSCHRSEIIAVIIIVPRIAIQLLNVMLVIWANIAPVSLMHDIRHSLFQTVPTLCISLNISIFAMFIHFWQVLTLNFGVISKINKLCCHCDSVTRGEEDVYFFVPKLIDGYWPS